MNRSFKAAAIFIVTALILTMPVFAQADLASNTNKATAGVFTSDVDDSQDVHYFSDVEFEKWFGFVGYGGNDTSTTYVDWPISLGFAKRFAGKSEGEGESNSGGIYLGTWYTGNVVHVTKTYTDSVVSNYDLANQIQTNKAISTTYTNGGTAVTSNNQFAALIGVAGMGFKVGFWENVARVKNPNKTVTETEYPDGTVVHSAGDIVNYSNVRGELKPSLEWGMKLDVGSIAIRPLVGFGIGIGLDNNVSDFRINGGNPQFTTVDGKVVGIDTIQRNGNESRYVNPDIYAGAGIDFEKFTVDVGYGINFKVYNNNYDAAGFSGKVKGTVGWQGHDTFGPSIAATDTENDLTLYIDELKEIGHEINLGFSTDKEFEGGLKLGLSAGIDITIDRYTSDSYDLTFTNTETKYNDAALSMLNTRTEYEERSFNTTEDSTTVGVAPYINLGASYVLVPGRFTLNAGIGIRPLTYSKTVTRRSEQNGSVETNKEYNGSGDLVNQNVTVNNGTEIEDSIDFSKTLSYLNAGLYGGFVFNFTEKLALDASFGGWLGPDASGSNSFLANVGNLNVLISYKY